LFVFFFPFPFLFRARLWIIVSVMSQAFEVINIVELGGV
jgi:hypothetical protein